MLCKRIVFTNDSGKIADEFINYIEKSDIHHKTHNEEDYREVVLKTDDERLYQVCLELSEKIKGIVESGMTGSFGNGAMGVKKEFRRIMQSGIQNGFTGTGMAELPEKPVEIV